MTPTKNNPRYANGNLRRKHRARLRAMGCECGIYPNVPDGGSAGAGGGTPAADGVEAAFKGMNPGLNV